MKRFEKITRLIPLLENEEAHGEWIVDRTSKETHNDPIQFPFVDYSRAAPELIVAVHKCVEDNEDLDAWDYRSVLDSYGLTDEDAMLEANSSKLDDRSTLALILTIIRGDRFCERLLLSYLDNGKILSWMKRLEELDAEQTPDKISQ